MIAKTKTALKKERLAQRKSKRPAKSVKSNSLTGRSEVLVRRLGLLHEEREALIEKQSTRPLTPADEKRLGELMDSKGDIAEIERTLGLEERREVVQAEDGSLPRVESKGYSIRGLDATQVHAANKFLKDCEAAYGALRSKGFEPVSFGERTHKQHLMTVVAQQSLKALQIEIGADDFMVLVAMVYLGNGPSDMKQKGGPDHKVISENLRRILNRVARFYDPGSKSRTSLVATAESIVAQFEELTAEIAKYERMA